MARTRKSVASPRPAPSAPRSNGRARKNPNSVKPAPPSASKAVLRKEMDTEATTAAVRFNKDKPGEYGSVAPPEGQHVEPASPAVTGSSLSESNTSAKTGRRAAAGGNALPGSLERVRSVGEEIHEHLM